MAFDTKELVRIFEILDIPYPSGANHVVDFIHTNIETNTVLEEEVRALVQEWKDVRLDFYRFLQSSGIDKKYHEQIWKLYGRDAT